MLSTCTTTVLYVKYILKMECFTMLMPQRKGCSVLPFAVPTSVSVQVKQCMFTAVSILVNVS